MFTLIEVLSDRHNLISLGLSVVSDLIFIGALWWAHVNEKKEQKD